MWFVELQTQFLLGRYYKRVTVTSDFGLVEQVQAVDRSS